MEKNDQILNNDLLQSDSNISTKINQERRIKIGISAMERKVNSKQMQNILKGIEAFDEFDIIIFTENIIFQKEVEDWPVVDALIIFFSNGYPYNKGKKYVELRKPFLINDFESQKIFWDRRKIFKILEEHKIPTPYHVIVDRMEEINNDGESSQKLSNSEEIENMINHYSLIRADSGKNMYSATKEAYFNPKEFTSEKSNKVFTPINGDQKPKFQQFNDFSTSSLLALDDERIQNLSTNGGTSFKIKTEDNFNPITKTNSGNLFELDIDDIKSEDGTEIDKLLLLEINNATNEEIEKKAKDDEIEKQLIEYDDHIEFKGVKILKPFVEKPCNGDDHNIHIYYPPSLGGGHKRLFRKTKNLCSLYIPNEDTIRRDKSYIYEEFLQTDGFDIKVYTIGPEYAHAEARKSPTLDGKVRRSSEGKEIRYPVNLTPFEKELARKVVAIFKQNICGFDILRSKGKSYVCDVNGWSFVKGNKKYYEDCAILIRKMILTTIEPSRYIKKPLSLTMRVPTYEELILPHRPSQNQKYDEELRSVVSVFRHADRSPKQKMKLIVNDQKILNLFKKFGKLDKDGNCSKKEIKLKKPKELMEVLNIAKSILEENNIDEEVIFCLNDSFFEKLFQLKMVLEKNLNFEGMTRKIQLKPLKYALEKNILGKDIEVITEALFICKWGGDITHSGIEQAKLLGNTFRVQMYPGDGDGLLRLHSTYRHDLKSYSSDEGRCLKTSAAFLQGLLQLEGSLIPIISSMVRKDEPVLDLLDTAGDDIADVKKKVKQEINDCLHHDGNLLEKFQTMFKGQVIFENASEKKSEEVEVKIPPQNVTLLNLSNDHSLYKLMNKINNPLKMLKTIYQLMDKLIQYIKTLLTQEELELDSGTYLIKRHVILQRRKPSDAAFNNNECFRSCSSPEDLDKINDIFIEEEAYSDNENLISESVKVLKGLKKTVIKKCPKHSNSAVNLKKRKKEDKLTKLELKKNFSPNLLNTNKLTTNNSRNSLSDSNKIVKFDCEDEKIILIYKRWIKLYQDFYSKKKKQFDISKIPDIYDNVKYDLIHNKSLMNDDAYNLYYNVNILANFVMPLEYGITVDEKLKIGLRVIGTLLNKIHNDLLWWLYPNKTNNYFASNNAKDFEGENEMYSGLDKERLNSDDIKSAWRHVKTRFYFTCASHLYSLINTIIFGVESYLIDQTESNQIFIKELKNVLDLDYCSHIVFRLYENFNFDFVKYIYLLKFLE